MSETVRPWRALLRLVRPAAIRYVALSVVLLAATVPSVAAPLIVRQLVDSTVMVGEAAQGGGADRIRNVGLLLLALSLAGQLLRVVVTWLATTTAWNTANDLRLRLTRQALRLDHEFHRSHTPGALIQRIDGDVTSVSDFLGRVVTAVGSGVLMLIGMVTTMLIINWRIGLGAMIYVLAIALLIARFKDRAIAEAETVMGTKAKLYGGIEERLTASEDLRANGAGVHAVQRFVYEASDNLDALMAEEHAFLRIWRYLNLSIAGAAALSVAVGGWMVWRGSITAGTAFLMFQYVLWLRRPMGDIVHQLDVVQKASGAMLRVDGLMRLEPAITDLGTVSPPPGPLAVEFQHVHFGYDSTDDDRGKEATEDAPDTDVPDTDGPVLVDVDLTIEAGRTVGIVGRTGSGKTTMSRLVLRLLDTTQGQLRLGGVPITDIPLAELRRRVALITQEVQLIRGSIRDNVTLFDESVSDEDVQAALDAVGLDVDPDAFFGPGGVGLSAGESQLLALARVWLRKPDLIVLDEATARVDPQTEANLHTAVAELLRGRTALIIAHRLSTLSAVDEIVVVDHGRVLEHGERIDLEADRSGRYRRLLDLALEDPDHQTQAQTQAQAQTHTHAEATR